MKKSIIKFRRIPMMLLALMLVVGLAPLNVFGATGGGDDTIDWGIAKQLMGDGTIEIKDENNPYGHKKGENFLMMEENELLLLQGGNGWGKQVNTAMFDTLSSSSYTGSLFTGAGFKSSQKVEMPGDFTVSELNFMQAVAFDPTGCGRRNYVAVVGLQKWNDNKDIQLCIFNAAENKWLKSFTIGEMWWADNSSEFYEMGNFLSITAGDYDNDGKDSLVVYNAGETCTSGKTDGYGLKEVRISIQEGDKVEATQSELSHDLLNPQYVKDYESIRKEDKGNSHGRVRLMGDVETGDVNGDMIDDLAVLSYTEGKSRDDYCVDSLIPYLAVNLGCNDAGYSITQKHEEPDEPLFGGYVRKNEVSPYVTLTVAGMTLVNTDASGGDEIIIGGHYVEYTFDSKDGRKYEDDKLENYLNVARYSFSKGEIEGEEKLTLDYLTNNGFDLNGNSTTLEENSFTDHWDSGWDGRPRKSVEGVYMNGKSNPGYVELGGDIYDCSTTGGPKLVYSYDYLEDQDDGCDGAIINCNCIPYAAVGNFDGNGDGYEQVIMTFARKQKGEDDYYVSYGIVGINPEKRNAKTGMPDNADLPNAFYETSEKSLNSYDISNKGDDLGQRLSCLVVAIDNDDDGILARYSGCRSVLTDPQVEAIVQYTPYFAELNGEKDLRYDGEYDKDYYNSTPQKCYAHSLGYAGMKFSFKESIGKGEGVNQTTTIESGSALNISTKLSEMHEKTGGVHSEEESFTTTYTTTKEHSSEMFEDSVLVSRTPHYYYGYDVYDAGTQKWAVWGHVISTTHEKRCQVFSVDAYNRFAEKYNNVIDTETNQLNNQIKVINNKIEEANKKSKDTYYAKIDLKDNKINPVHLTKVDPEACYLRIAKTPAMYLGYHNTPDKNLDLRVLCEEPATMPQGHSTDSVKLENKIDREKVKNVANGQTSYHEAAYGYAGELGSLKVGSYVNASVSMGNTTRTTEGKSVDLSMTIAGIGACPDYTSDDTSMYSLKCQLAEWNSNIDAPNTDKKNYADKIPVYGCYICDLSQPDYKKDILLPEHLTIKRIDNQKTLLTNSVDATTEGEKQNGASEELDETLYPLELKWRDNRGSVKAKFDKYGIFLVERNDKGKIDYKLVGEVDSEDSNRFIYEPKEERPFWQFAVCALDAEGNRVSPMSNIALGFAKGYFGELECISVEKDSENDSLYSIIMKKFGDDEKVIDRSGIVSIEKDDSLAEEGFVAYKISFKSGNEKTIKVRDRGDKGIESIKRIDEGNLLDQYVVKMKDGREFHLKLPSNKRKDTCPKNETGVHMYRLVNYVAPGKNEGYTGDHICEYCGDVLREGKVIPASIKLSETTFAYDGKIHKPSVTVGGFDKSEYTLSWSGDGKNVGKYYVTVKFADSELYAPVELSYVVNPKGTTIKSLKKSKKAFTVKWKRQSGKMSKSRITGYQVEYATDSTFTKNKKTVTVKGYKKTSKTIKKLKANKKYYVRVRTYKKEDSNTFYSAWSKKKTVKTR